MGARAEGSELQSLRSGADGRGYEMLGSGNRGFGAGGRKERGSTMHSSCFPNGQAKPCDHPRSRQGHGEDGAFEACTLKPRSGRVPQKTYLSTGQTAQP